MQKRSAALPSHQISILVETYLLSVSASEPVENHFFDASCRPEWLILHILSIDDDTTVQSHRLGIGEKKDQRSAGVFPRSRSLDSPHFGPLLLETPTTGR